jgi:hypothetical protein
MGKAKSKGQNAKHTHRYIKIGGNYTPLWKCAEPDCKFFVYTAQENVIVGRFSQCWGCGLKFIMDEDAMKEDQPRCFACRHPEFNLSDDDIAEKLKEALKDEIEVIDDSLE